MTNSHWTRLIRDVPDFPKPGIVFKDIMPVLADAAAFDDAIEALAAPWHGVRIDAVLAMEARGFLLGTPLARALGAGIVPLRKPGKLPGRVFTQAYALEYGEDALEVQADALPPGARVLLADDVLATGGTLLAAHGLAKQLNVQVVGVSMLIELGFLNGRARWDGDAPLHAALLVSVKAGSRPAAKLTASTHWNRRMLRPPKPDNEADRLRALSRYQILDTAPEGAFDDLVAIAVAICGMPMGAVTLIDTDRQWFKARIGLDAPETPRMDAFCAHAILDPNAVMVVVDAREDARFRDNPLVTGDPGIRFYAGSPLRSAEGLPMGALCVIDREPRTLEPYQLDALDALSRQVSALLELRRVSRELNLQLQDRDWYEQQLRSFSEQLELHNADLSEQVRSDALTGLGNRRALGAALELALDDDHACCVALIDIDHFKAVNDTHGHAAGDDVLVQVANTLRASSAGHGVLARHGGEEFAWVMPGVDLDQALLQCEYLREAVKFASAALPVTISIGVAMAQPGDTVSNLLQRADTALYAAKHAGRDRVMAG